KGAGKHDLMHSIRNRKVDSEGFGPVERLQSLIRSSTVSNVAIIRDLNREVQDRLVMDTTLSSSMFDRNKVSETYNRSKLAVSNALAAVLKTGTAGAERTRFVKWFGAYNEARKQEVVKNFRNLNSLFTSGVIIVKDARAIPGAWGDCFGFAMPGNKQNYVEFSVGRAFFLKQGYNTMPGATPQERGDAVKLALAQAYANTSDWTVGTMIHELGHAINNLPDVNFQAPATYAIHPGMTPGGWTQVSTPDLDEALAIARPELAVQNTDNYGQFARECL
ncbi:MAG: Lysine-specific metallo-endopeptidase, partial [Pseudomonadota bacterium]